MKKGEFVASQSFKNIPYWTVWQAVDYLGASEGTHLADATPGDARAAAVARIQAHLLQSSAQQCIKESDYALVVHILNTMKEIMDTMLVGARFPEMSPASMGRNGEFAALQRYTEEVYKFLQGPPPPPPPPEW